ncbi:unnamed protein product [Mytilus edulis]|uniref:Retrotransposon gag domain-containing protein n=1 Tax=Mytilus edulis TaxID=6550 RepID=A0A8S3R7V7_MYTED|nr:unnamed protein product [Mytilus edulis]
METPRRTTRTSTQAPTLSQVRQNCFRNQVSPADSGLGNSPATGRTLNDFHTETMPEVLYRRNIGHCYPRKSHYRVIQERSNTEKDGGNGWKKFWQIWVILLTLSSGLVASAWIYFPNNRVVQKSQEYVMIGLLVIIGLLICTIVLKLIWNSVLNGQKIDNAPPTWSERRRRSDDSRKKYIYRTPAHTIMDESDTPYDSDEVPSYSCPSPNSPVFNGQRNTEMELSGHESENMGASTKQIQSPDFHNRTNELTTDMPKTRCFRVRNIRPANEYPVRRTFSGVSDDVWNEFIQYFENISELNVWNNEKARRVLLSTLRGQAETFAYGMPLIIQRDYERLKQKMEERFGHTAMKERYVTEAKLRKKQPEESLRDFGQTIEDLYRRAYPDTPEIVEENSIKAFLDKCGQSEDFRLAVKRTRPKTLQDAVLSAMQEECLRAGEKDLAKDGKIVNRQIYEVDDGGDIQDVATNGNSRTIGSTDHEANNRSIEKSPHSYPYDSGRGYRGRPYSRGNARGRGRYPRYDNRSQNFRGREEPRRDFDARPLN